MKLGGGILLPGNGARVSRAFSPFTRSAIYERARDLSIVLLLLTTSSGCTTLQVYGADGIQSTTQRFPGIVEIKFDSHSGALGYIRSSVGVAASSDGFALGYARTATVRITNPELCQAVVLVANGEAAREVHGLFAELGASGRGLCVENKWGTK